MKEIKHPTVYSKLQESLKWMEQLEESLIRTKELFGEDSTSYGAASQKFKEAYNEYITLHDQNFDEVYAITNPEQQVNGALKQVMSERLDGKQTTIPFITQDYMNWKKSLIEDEGESRV